MQISELPSPPGALPLVGHAYKVDITSLHHLLERWATELGGLYRVQIGRDPVVIVSAPEHVSQILKQRPKTFRRTNTLAQIIEELGVKGVFTAEGERWTSQRKLAMRALGQHRLPRFYPLLRRVAADLLDRWTATAHSDNPILDDFVCFTVDVTTELAFADKAGSLHGQRSSLLQNLDPIFPALARRLYALVPYWRWFKLPRDRRLDVAIDEVRNYVAETVARARTQTSDREDFLTAMLEETDGAGAFDEEDLFSNAMTMLLAGEDTTANTLAWAVHLLLDHPEVFARIRAEAEAAITTDIAPTIEDTRLPYLESVIHEVMRLKPVAPILFHQALVDTRLGDLELHAGDGMMVLTRHAALDAERFAEPRQFDPDRWTDPKRIGREQKQGSFVPFGSGPRICPGRAMALLEIRLVLSMLARTFDLERVGESSEVTEVNGFTMSPRGLRVRLIPRDQV